MSQIAQAAAAVDADPYDLPTRLDWADALAAGGRGNLARWVRVRCGFDAAAGPIELAARGLSLRGGGAYRNRFDWSENNANGYWRFAAPPGWPPAEEDGFVRARAHFGRWTVFCPAAADHSDAPSAEERLAAAESAGVLEVAAYAPQSAAEVEVLAERAAEVTRRPATLDLTKVGGANPPAGVVRRVLAADWREAALTPDVAPPAVRPDVPGLIGAAETLRLEFPRASQSFSALWAGLPAMRRLRHVSAFGSAVGDAEAALLKDCPALRAVALGDGRLSDAGLTALGDVPNLRHLGLDSRTVTRAGVVAFRTARPDVGLWLSEDTIQRIGPA